MQFYFCISLNTHSKIKYMDTKKIQIVYRNIDELIEPEYNSRKISAKQREDIKRSLEKFGFVQPLVINALPERLNIVIGGNQRLKIAKAMGYEQAPCIEVVLDIQKEKELNLRLNKNQAEFDFKMLTDFFDKSFLLDVGFDTKEIGSIESEFEEKFKAITDENCEMPIVPQLNILD